MSNQNEWTPSSWTAKPVVQDVKYDDPEHLSNVLNKLGHLPPLVCPEEIDNLRQQLADVAVGKKFLLQGGDCAELFEYCSKEPIESKLKVLLQMSLVLTWGARTSVVRIARMAGQYAKPRSKPTEVIDGKEVLSFRGDNVNGFEPSDRKPDPERLLGAYFHSAATLNYVRALVGAGFADLHHPSSWDLGHVKKNEVRRDYQEIIGRLTDAIGFMQTIGVDNATPSKTSPLYTVDMFMSHEGLLLEYEQALTRRVGNSYYNLGSHFLWVGDRTRQLDGAHVEYFRGIKNPIGIKCGPSMQADELVRLLDIVDSNFEVGRVTLITRYGADRVKNYLPEHVDAVKESKHQVVWCCDPMHGNTETSNSGVKTRQFDNIAKELSESFRIHKERGSILGGVHFELTGDSVTECIGGSMELRDADLPTNYKTYCDPRLNYEQSLDIAFLIAKYCEKERSGIVSL
ncbi:phospho-2-dehydro-3-deoxyheptonate aldolase, class II [Paraphysoderma sedebokerense]|nr:phospho-2-dehydro-3-deoxyheptonate aldolase, class II [Paraphysoderma sedebokerense]